MRNAARAFDKHRGDTNVRPIDTVPDDSRPYANIQGGEMPPMMLQLRLHDGRWISFAYGDVREIICRDAGHLTMSIYASARTLITIEGRHLRELSTLLGMASVRWIQEADPRSPPRDESESEITRVSVELIPEA